MLKVIFKKRRHHSLTGRITMTAMVAAFKAVKKNRGAAGLDKVSINMFEANLEQNLIKLMKDLKTGAYNPIPLLRVFIPKGPKQLRPLGIPAVRCRVAQEVIRKILSPIFERIFHNSSHGFRPARSCHTAMKQLVHLQAVGYVKVLDADIKGFFDNIPHQLIIELVKREIADGNIIRLIEKFLRAGVMEDGTIKPTTKGTPQGGVISPLLANIVLNHLDWTLEAHGLKFVRYADDFVVLCKSKPDAEKALLIVKKCVEDDLGLTLHPEKTTVTSFYEGFNFLGYYVNSRTIRMSAKAVERFKNKIRDATIRCHNLDQYVVVKVNRIIRGTLNYFCMPFSSCLGQYNEIDKWIRRRIRCMKYKRIRLSDNRRLRNRSIARVGFVTCRSLYLNKRNIRVTALP